MSGGGNRAACLFAKERSTPTAEKPRGAAASLRFFAYPIVNPQPQYPHGGKAAGRCSVPSFFS